MKYELFIDFDGTISTVDTLEYLLNNFADYRWREIEDKISQGEMDESEGLKRQFKLIRLSREEALYALERVVQLDSYFKTLLVWCQGLGIRTTIISGGFNWIISHFLKKNGIQGISLKANDSIIRDGKWEIIPGGSPLECKKCNHCKAQYLRFSKEKGIKPIFVGDGNTDRCPSKEAEILFAKGSLKEFCIKEDIKFYPFNNLNEVYLKLKGLLEEIKPDKRE